MFKYIPEQVQSNVRKKLGIPPATAPIHSKPLVPFPRYPPFDILSELIMWADVDTLLALSLINREVNRETNKYIWRKLDLTEPNRVQAAARMLRSDPSRPSYVREVKINLPAPDTKDHLENPRESWDEIFETLTSLCNLRKLEILADQSFGEIAQRLSTYTFPFRLNTFHTNLYCSDGLVPFLQAHPEIESFILYPRPGHVAGHLDPHLLPRLRVVNHPEIGIAEVVKGRPVDSIILDLRSTQGVYDLVKAITSTTALPGLTTLRLYIHQAGLLQTLFSGLIANAPALSSISIGFRSFGAYLEMERDKDLKIIGLMKQLPSLHTCIWRGFLTPDTVKRPDLFACPSMRRVEIINPGSAPVILIRDADGAEWCEVERY